MSQISLREPGDLTLELLRLVHSDHIKRGPDGRTSRAALNQFGETSLLAGFMAEEVVIARLHVVAAEHGITFRVISMDHPDQMIPADAPIADYTVFMVGLEGTAALASASDGQLRFRTSTVPLYKRPQYATRIAIAEGESPLFSRIVAAGALKPTTNQILIARKGGGVRLYGAYQIGSDEIVHANSRWDPDGLVYCDSSLPCLLERFAGPLLSAYQMTTITPATGTQSLFDVTVGHALASCDWAHNGGLELITAYLLVTEAGGIVADMTGFDIGYESTTYLEANGLFCVAAGSESTLEYILTAVPDPLLAH